MNSLSRLRVELDLSKCYRLWESESMAMGSVGGFARQNWSGAFEVAASPSIIMGIPYTIASCCFEDPMRQS